MLRSHHSISSVISVNATTLRSTLIGLKRNNPGYTITPNALDMKPFQGRYISLNGLLHKPKKKKLQNKIHIRQHKHPFMYPDYDLDSGFLKLGLTPFHIISLFSGCYNNIPEYKNKSAPRTVLSHTFKNKYK